MVTAVVIKLSDYTSNDWDHVLKFARWQHPALGC